MSNVRYRRAIHLDFPEVVRLNEANFIANLSEKERQDGFLSALFTEQQVAAMADDLGIMIAVVDGRVAGFLCAFRNEFAHGSAVVAQMIASYGRMKFQGQPLDSYRTYVYGPVCVAKAFRRQGLLRRYRHVLVASRHMIDEYRRHGVAADRLHHLALFPAGMVPDAAPPTVRPPNGAILMAGRLTDLKGGAHLIQALPRAAKTLGMPLSLVVAGDGSERPRLESLAARHGVRADFVGWVPAAARERLMRQADLVALPSVWPEPFGLIGIEAGCFGVPAVGYAVGGIPDWLVPGESGELAPGDPPTIAGLADALVRALRNPDHLARLRRGAWGMAQRFTLRNHVDGLERILEAAAR
jgi:glycosyltransferase involved in cell wall biosynthesis